MTFDVEVFVKPEGSVDAIRSGIAWVDSDGVLLRYEADDTNLPQSLTIEEIAALAVTNFAFANEVGRNRDGSTPETDPKVEYLSDREKRPPELEEGDLPF